MVISESWRLSYHGCHSRRCVHRLVASLRNAHLVTFPEALVAILGALQEQWSIPLSFRWKAPGPTIRFGTVILASALFWCTGFGHSSTKHFVGLNNCDQFKTERLPLNGYANTPLKRYRNRWSRFQGLGLNRLPLPGRLASFCQQLLQSTPGPAATAVPWAENGLFDQV